MAAVADYRALEDRVLESQSRMLQDYFLMSIENGPYAHDWVSRYESVLKREAGGAHGTNYKGPKDTFESIGADNFTAFDLDVSIIQQLFVYHRRDLGLETQKPKVRPFQVNSYMGCIHDDRNELYAHSSQSENTYDLFSYNAIRLNHLLRFNKAVRADPSLRESQRSAYYDKWNIAIRELSLDLQECFSSVEGEHDLQAEINADIRRMLSAKDRVAKYFDLYQRYLSNRDNEQDPFRGFIEFQRAAARAGIDEACMMLGDYYFDGVEAMHCPVDYSIAASYYRKVKKDLNPPQKINLASIYLNGLDEGHDEEEGKSLLDSCPDSYGAKKKMPYQREGKEFFGYFYVRGEGDPPKPSAPAVVRVPKPVPDGSQAERIVGDKQSKRGSYLQKAEEYLRRMRGDSNNQP